MAGFVKDGATMKDALELARAFHALGVWSHAPLDIEAVQATFEQQAETETGFLAYSKQALIMGMIAPVWFSPGTNIGIELIWYSRNPADGQAMRRAFEEWATAKGVSEVQFSCMANEREAGVRRLFRQAGFEPIEIGFRKTVGWASQQH